MSKEPKYKCNMCKGLGVVMIKQIEWDVENDTFDHGKEKMVETKCFRCKGIGYVDWITNITDNHSWQLDISMDARVLKDEDG